ncbi:TipC family immunity protein [Arcanobacterium pinnipediorum]|uniref:TipC family immunity protein n=1 Tax=Arcanobacterium pinnipediorum TaxID=1503041 RepID=A0ABY5AJ39_9ACTO|nr:TipC family immunity protein [Arcanobacterium pinnipediorum]USR80222.1 TipC family immunity protein [Arcanobacterium pinnipediorum]
MSKKTYRWGVFGAFLVAVGVVVWWWITPQYANVFEEMYEDERGIFTEVLPWSSFRDLPNILGQEYFVIRSRAFELDSYTIDEAYAAEFDTSTLDGWKIDFFFSYIPGDEQFSIFFNGHDEEKGVDLTITYGYDFQAHVLRENVYLRSENGPAVPLDDAELREYLADHGVSVEDVKVASDELLFDRVIHNWVTYTWSDFSADNLGDIKIVRSSFYE